MPIAVSHNGSRIACGGADRRMYFFDGGATPSWSLEVANQQDDQVSDLAISDDGSRLVVAGDDRCLFFDDTTVGTPSWEYGGSYGATGTFGPAAPHAGSNNPPGDYGIGHYPGTVALSADGKYIALGPWNSGHLFSLYRGLGRPFRMYDLDRHNQGWGDPVNRVAISADGARIAAGSTFSGAEIHLWEIAPAEMIKLGLPITVHVPEEPLAGDIIDAGEIAFTRYFVKPGRGATLRRRTSLWVMLQGIPVPPELGQMFGSGDVERTQTFTHPDGNFDEIVQDQMDVPQFFASYVSTITTFLLRNQLFDDPSNTELSDEGGIFADVQIGSGGP